MREKIKLKAMEVSFFGSIIANDNYFSRLLRKKIGEKFDDVVVKEPAQSPAIGAILIAKDIMNV